MSRSPMATARMYGRTSAKPALDMLEEIAAQYLDFDLNYVVRGKRTIEFDVWKQMQDDNELLRRERNIFLSTMEKMGKSNLKKLGHIITQKVGVCNLRLTV